MNILHHLHYYNNRSNDSVRGLAKLSCTSHGNNGSWDNFYPFVAVKKEDKFWRLFLLYILLFIIVRIIFESLRNPFRNFI